jgi:hypothetical protein
MIRDAKFLFAVAMASALVGAAEAATYNGDLLVGFTTGVGNDVIYDLGPAASLTDGQTWNLSSLLTGYNLNNVNWGVIGTKVIGSNGNSWTTVDPSMPDPAPLPSLARWSQLNTALKSIYGNFSAAGAGQSLTIASTDDNSWNQQTINGALATQYVNVYDNPNVLGAVTDNFYSMVATNQPPQLIGHFSLGTNAVVTFHIASSGPPPATQLSITRGGSVATISFLTGNGFTYTLYYTNSGGLNTPIAGWPASPNTVIGNGGTNSIQDTSSDANRFYRVGAH